MKKAPKYFKLSGDCRDFFYNDGIDLTVEKLMNLFFFFEHLCFDYLLDTLQNEYKKEIPDELKTKIVKKLLNKEIPFSDIISIKALGAALRRLISRYLAGKSQVADVDENRELSLLKSCKKSLVIWELQSPLSEDLVGILPYFIFTFILFPFPEHWNFKTCKWVSVIFK